VFWQDFVIQTVQKLVMTAVSIVAAIIYKSYVALLAGIVVAQLTQLVVSYLFVPYRPRFRLAEYRDLIGFSGWLTLTQIVQTINWRLDPLIVGKFLGASQLGIFTVFGRLAAIPTTETVLPLTGTLFPALRHIRGDAPRLQAAAVRAQSVISAVALPCGCAMAILAEPLVLLAMGHNWTSAIYVLQILSVATGFQTLAMVHEPLSMATGNTRLTFRRSLQLLGFRLPIIIIGLYYGGLPGLMVARVILAIYGVFLDMLVIKQVLNLSFMHQFLPHWRTIIGCCAMGVFAWLCGSSLNFGPTSFDLLATIALKGVLAGMVYLVCIFVLWALSNKPNGPETELLRVLNMVFRHSIRLPKVSRIFS
jgi:O-antigen/teichoic acid export membrane protein